MRDITIAEATAGDVPALSKLGADTFTAKFGPLYAAADLQAFIDTAHSAAYYASAVASQETAVWKAESVSGGLVGYALAGPLGLPVEDAAADALEIKRLYVSTAYQSAGLGGLMMEVMLGWARAQGDPSLYLGVYSDNTGAQKFYGRYGFRRIGQYQFPVGSHLDLEYIYLKARQ